MSFWVYENWQAGPHKAVIHAQACGFCNDGKGRSEGDYDRRHAEWRGPFQTLGEAQTCSMGLRGVVKRQEHFCVSNSSTRVA